MQLQKKLHLVSEIMQLQKKLHLVSDESLKRAQLVAPTHEILCMPLVHCKKLSVHNREINTLI